MNIYEDLYEIIGKTPLYALDRLSAEHGCCARIAAKLEFMNPGGSIKDRAAFFMLRDGKERGEIGDETVIIEPTSGNTGIGLAMLCAAEGRRCILVMPDTMSMERRTVFAAYGAELVLTPGAKGMTGSIEEAKRLADTIPDSFIPSQFDNPANARAHYATTGPEIWDDTDGSVDIFVAAAGTGGTVTGTGAYLKSQNPDIKVYAAEPASSPVISGGEAGAHKIQGIGAGFIPDVLDTEELDGVITVTDREAYEFCRELAQRDGILCGISSGAAAAAAVKLARKAENEGKLIVTVLPDTGGRYLSTVGLWG